MLFLAIRHLLSRKKQSTFIFIGVTLGAFVYVVISSTQLGFREYIIEQLVDNDAHVKISGREELIEPKPTSEIFFPKSAMVAWVTPPAGKRDEARVLYPQGWFARLNREPEVTAYAEQMTMQVIASKGGVKNNAVLIGIVPEKQRKVSILEKYMLQGKLSDIGSSGNRVIAGQGLLKKIGAQVGDTILLGSTGSAPKPFKISGVFKIGVQQMDDAYIYGALRDVQQLNGTPGRITQIAVRLNDVTDARVVAERWAAGAWDKVQSWDQANASFLQVFKIQDLFRNFITIGMMVVAGFGIYNVLSIIVNQKRREVAILRSLGFTPKEVLHLFLIQGLIIGLIGSTLGLTLGALFSSWLTTLDFEFMSRKGLLISFNPIIYIQGFAMTFGASILASWLPAHSASRMTPIEIIRQEGS